MIRLLASALALAGLAGAHAHARVAVTASQAVYAELARRIGGSDVDARIAPAGSAEGLTIGRRLAPSNADHYAWCDPLIMRDLARRFAAALSAGDPATASSVSRRLAAYEADLDRLESRMNDLEALYRGSTVFALDPLSRRMTGVLRFAVDTTARDGTAAGTGEPDVAALSTAVGERAASILLYDADRRSSGADRLVALAKESGVPVVALRERPPSALTYQAWMTRETNAIRGALNEAAP
jgi:hypothetical protein